MIARRLLVVSDCAHGGTFHVAKLLAEGLRDGFSITLALPPAPDGEALSAELGRLGVEVIRGAPSYENLDRSSYAVDAAADLLDAARPDLILSVDGAELSSLLAIKTVAHRRGIPYVIVVNLLSDDALVRFAPFLDAAKASLLAAEKVVFVSQASLRRCRDLLPDVAFAGRAIPNGVPDRFFSPRDETIRRAARQSLGIVDGQLLCLTTARIEDRKGQHLCVTAVGELARTGRAERLRWALAGRAEPYDRDRLETAIRDLGVTAQFDILGERGDIRDLLDASDLFVLTSYAEGMPLCVIEAMARGVPVVATAIDGIVEQVDESCGILLPAPAGNETACIAALAAALDGLERDRDGLLRLGAAARARALAQFHPAIGIARYRALLDAVPTPRPSARLPASHGLGTATALDFADRASIWNHLEDGWSACERNGIWTDGPISTMRLRFSDDVGRLRLRFDVTPFDRRRSRVTRVFANDRLVGTWRARRGRNWLGIEIDPREIGRKVLLRFENPGAVRPCDIGLGGDWRQLALFFRRVEIDPAAPPSGLARAVGWLRSRIGGKP